MTLVSTPFRAMRRRLHVDRVVHEDWLYAGDPERITPHRMENGKHYPFPSESYVNALADVVFRDFEYSDGPKTWKYSPGPLLEDAEGGGGVLASMAHEQAFKTPVEEALFNALLWGNRADPTLPVHVQVFEGRDGRILRVTDAGDGFDYRTKIRQLLAGEQYWQNHGNGLRNLHQNPFIHVGYNTVGNATSIQVWFPEGVPHRQPGVRIPRKRTA